MIKLIPRSLEQEWNQTPNLPQWLNIDDVIYDLLVKNASEDNAKIAAAIATGDIASANLNPTTAYTTNQILNKSREFAQNLRIAAQTYSTADFNSNNQDGNDTAKPKKKKLGQNKEIDKLVKRAESKPKSILATLAYLYCLEKLSSNNAGSTRLGFNTLDKKTKEKFSKDLYKKIYSATKKHSIYSFLSRDYRSNAGLCNTLEIEKRGILKHEKRCGMAAISAIGPLILSMIIMAMAGKSNVQLKAGSAIVFTLCLAIAVTLGACAIYFASKKLKQEALSIQKRNNAAISLLQSENQDHQQVNKKEGLKSSVHNKDESINLKTNEQDNVNSAHLPPFSINAKIGGAEDSLQSQKNEAKPVNMLTNRQNNTATIKQGAFDQQANTDEEQQMQKTNPDKGNISNNQSTANQKEPPRSVQNPEGIRISVAKSTDLST